MTDDDYADYKALGMSDEEIEKYNVSKKIWHDIYESKRKKEYELCPNLKTERDELKHALFVSLGQTNILAKKLKQIKKLINDNSKSYEILIEDIQETLNKQTKWYTNYMAPLNRLDIDMHIIPKI